MLIVLVCFLFITINASDVCVSPAEWDGICVNISSCPWLSEQGSDVVRIHICEFTSDEQFTVCCPTAEVVSVPVEHGEELKLSFIVEDITTTTGSTLAPPDCVPDSQNWEGKCVTRNLCPWLVNKDEEVVNFHTCEVENKTSDFHVCCPTSEVVSPTPIEIDVQIDDSGECYLKWQRVSGSCTSSDSCPWYNRQANWQKYGSRISCRYVNDPRRNVCCPETAITYQDTAYSSCLTYQKTGGKCTNMKSCKSLQKKIKSAVYTGLSILQKSVCGYTKDNDILVCCPDKIKDTDSSTQRPVLFQTQPTTRQPVITQQSQITTKTSTTTQPVTTQTRPTTRQPVTTQRTTLNDNEFLQYKRCSNPPRGSQGRCVKKSLCPIRTSRRHICAWTNRVPWFCCPTSSGSSSTSSSTDLSRKTILSECGYIPRYKVSGGTDSTLGTWPWIAALIYDFNAVKCAGALLTRKHVVTAAHCVKAATATLTKVRLGEWDWSKERDCENGICAPAPQEFTPKRIITHPEYTRTRSGAAYNDIAIIELDGTVQYSEWVAPVCLDDGRVKRAAQKAWVIGWGKTGINEGQSKILQQLQLPILSKEECRAQYGALRIDLTDVHICSGGVKGEDSCKGDSGGPLLVPTRGFARYYLIGVVSFGARGCGTNPLPGVYANIEHYYEWIFSHIAS